MRERKKNPAVKRPDPAKRDMIYFSVHDFFGYLRAHATLSGIQRVQAGIALYAMEHEPERSGFILNDLEREAEDGEFLMLDHAAFRAAIDYAASANVNHQRLRDLLERSEKKAVPVRPGPGETIIILGSFWGHGNRVDRYVTPKRNGVSIGVYVYDIIPITHPEYCQEALVWDFSLAVCEMGVLADFIFTISDYSGEMLGRFFNENGGRDVPIATVPLAHTLAMPDKSERHWPSALAGIKDRPIVGYISTVEGRKNHIYVVNAWKQLVAEGVDVPDLVFVGRPGWRIAGLVDLLEGTKNLGGRVHIVHDLTDAELNSVYSACLFTVFTSFVEGWGLPVGESLVHGVPCVASAVSSIPEVGGDFVDYVDPLDIRGGIEAFRKLIVDGEYLQARKKHIAEEFEPRSWKDVGRDFFQKTKEAAEAGHVARDIRPMLLPGRKFDFGEFFRGDMSIQDYLPSPMRLSLAGSFYALEEHGAWMIGRFGEICFFTGLAEGTDIDVRLHLHTTFDCSQEEKVAVGLRTKERRSRAFEKYALAPNLLIHCNVRGKVGPEGLCRIAIELSGLPGPRPPDMRLFGIGVSAVGYAPSSDHRLREELAESFAFNDITPIADLLTPLASVVLKRAIARA